MAIDEDLNNLEEWIRRLRVEYLIYFNGHRKKPPDDLKFRVEKVVKRLSESNMSISQRFRYNTLVTRFYVFRDLWRRTQASKDQDGGKGGAPLKPTAAAVRRHEDGEIVVSIADPGAEEDKVRDLYEGLQSVRGKETKGFPEITYKQFSDYIATQTRGIREKSGCARVRFRVHLEENAIKFTAKADDGA